MSTSNIKTPSTIRQGFILPWINFKKANLFNINDVLWRELYISNITPLSYIINNDKLTIFYYRWIQIPFKSRSKVQQLNFYRQFIKRGVLLSKLNLKTNIALFKLYKTHNSFLFNHDLIVRSNYIIPISIQRIMVEKFHEFSRNQFSSVALINVHSCDTKIFFNLLDIQKFIYETPLIKGNIRSVYYIGDMVSIVDLLSQHICSIDLLTSLIVKVLERNSKKGYFLRSLRILAKLSGLIRNFELQKDKIVIRNWSWVIRIAGKLSGMGRTKVYYIRPYKLPLHSISQVITYHEDIANNKVGTFSVKIWDLN